MKELFKAINGFSNYEVSNMGNVRRKADKLHPPQPLSPQINSAGYYFVGLYADKAGRKFKLISDLVLDTFIGPRRKGDTVSHLNHDKSDNSLANLCYEPLKANMARNAPTHATHYRRIAQLSATDKATILAQAKAKVPLKDIAQRFGMTRTLVAKFVCDNLTATQVKARRASTKLTQADATHIRQLSTTVSAKALAAQYNVNVNTIYHIKQNKTWAV